MSYTDADHLNAPGGETAQTELPTSVDKAIALLRRSLLDIGKRNRLINTPLANKRAKQLKIVDELSDEVFAMLTGGKTMSFLPNFQSKEEDNEEDLVYVPPDDEFESGLIAERHKDTKLQTELKPEALQKRLLSLFRDSQAMEEEQGVNVLYLALGFLKWYESENSDIERFSPLILLPVDLKRDTARGRFKLSIREQDLEPNLSLRAMLSTDFDLALPDLPEGDEWAPSDYFSQVERLISSKARWSIERDAMVLGFYSFAKFLMWRDLDAAAWPQEGGLNGSGLIDNILASGFDDGEFFIEGMENLDEQFPDPSSLCHILDADASQTEVIKAARDGRNLVVQGPPGTGKSQTIANIIAVAARDGKRVLFMAEKRAALDVVHDRLDKAGLGPLCLELHSRMANKKYVLAELGRTLELGPPRSVDQWEYDTLASERDALNEMSRLLHHLDEQTGESAHRIVGQIARLREKGAAAPDFELSEASQWDREAAGKRLMAVSSLANLTEEFGPEHAHPWRGVRARLSPMDRERLAPRLEETREATDRLGGIAHPCAKAIGLKEEITPQIIERIEGRLAQLAVMPEAAPVILAAEALRANVSRAQALLKTLSDYKARKTRLGDSVNDVAFDMSWIEARQAIGAHGASIFRFLNGSYRAAISTFRSVQTGPLPKTQVQRLEQIDSVIAVQKLQLALEKDAGFGGDAFGDLWRGVETPLEPALSALEWVAAVEKEFGGPDELNAIVQALPGEFDAGAEKQKLEEARRSWRSQWDAVSRTLQIDIDSAFGIESIETLHLTKLSDRLALWAARLEDLEDWHRLYAAACEVAELGLTIIRDRVGSGELSPESAPDAYLYARAEAVWRYLIKTYPELQSLDGKYRTERAESFRDKDDRLKALACQEIALAHFNGLPRGASGQMRTVRGEIGKKSRHMALRKLMDSAGEAIATIKPVFLMSPLSVAQYLKPGRLEFDLVVIDEASQVRPEDAIGAIARGRQVIVVGDRHQLPPTSFFDRQVAGDGEDDEEQDEESTLASQVGDMESILTLCDARAMPGATLKWHYRSRHPSLIAVSNHTFYEDKLIFPPSPEQAGAASGLRLIKVDGVYDRGKKRNNPIEARAVLAAVLEHARETPDLSLGVVTFSVAQRDAIRNELELMRAETPELDAFCRESNAEPFFVKNLENVQGDERDVIFISVGYGRDADGYMSQSFGPVTSEGGERRLNVLFTRAKQRCEIFTSIDHNDIRTDASRHAGPRVLKRYLKYAATGEMDVPTSSGREMDSPFEEAVASALRKEGYSVDAQVGSAGFFVDLAISDPDRPGRYLLGIECDGARYHSSRWARERDRLRQIVLESKGWRLHRIWSTDWFYKPEAEKQKLFAAIDRARTASGLQTRRTQQRTGSLISVERDLPIDTSTPETTPYVEADIQIQERGHLELHEFSANNLALYVKEIIQIEGPVHIEEVGRRLSRLWGYQRAGARIQQATLEAARCAERAGMITRCPVAESPFYINSDNPDSLQVRDRSIVAAATLRKLDMLPPSEIDLAVTQSVERNVSLTVDQCAVEVARMFGFKSTSAEFQKLIQQRVDVLVHKGKLCDSEGGLRTTAD